jgi:uncharacterized membrane protein YccF (DUF307 family)
MGPGESVVACPRCGQATSPSDVTCPTCGATLLVPGMLSDPNANMVAGAPVPQSERGARDHYGGPPAPIARIGPEIADIVSEAITQRAAEISDRMSRRSAEIGERIARKSTRWADRVSRQSEHWAERISRRSERYAQRLARRAGREDMPVEESWRGWSVKASPPRPYPVRYTAPRQNVFFPTRAVWFVVAGSWLSGLWVLATWVMILFVVFQSQANRMITMIPNVLTLRTAGDPPKSIVPVSRLGMPNVDTSTRALYMVFLGWWLSLVWMMLAWAISLTVIGIPISYRMYSVAPTIAHL